MNPYDNAETLLRVLAAPRRNQFFYGKRMDVQHFRMEQDYGRLKQSLLNRLTVGKGVLCGLRVGLDDGRLCVDPGVALDGLGREIVVPVRTCVDAPAGDDSVGFFTLWACYRECSADYQPVLASDCATRSDCAPGTTVETFCFKVTPGLAPLQDDPRWCASVRPDSHPGTTPAEPPGTTPGELPDAELPGSFFSVAESRRAPGLEAIRDALASRRHLLCAATTRASCDAAEGDPCVPLAAILMSDGRPLALENCLVRPRVYSNAVLLDLILCLAERIDACCKQTPAADLLRVSAIDFVHRGGPAGESAVASVDSPLAATQVRIGGRTNAIRIRFSKPFAQDAHRPTTAVLGDNNFKRHNVLVVPEQELQGMPFVPGTLTVEGPQVVRFDLHVDSPYSRGPELGWQKGRYRILLCGTEDAASGRRALTDLAGVPLDGEPSAPANSAISGDGAAAGDFVAAFVVG